MLKKVIGLLVVVFTVLLSNVAVAAVKYKQGAHEFTSTGYFRVGVGTSEGGTSQTRFKLPGARSAPRLGNEPETLVEVEFQYAYVDPVSNKQAFKVFAGRTHYSTHGRDNELNYWSQAYIVLNDVYGDADIWFGRRYFDRKRVYLMNHFWLDFGQSSHVGGGIENLTLPVGALDISIFQYRDKNGVDEIRNHALDFRWRGLEISDNSQLTLWAQLSKRDKNDILGYSGRSGSGVGFWLDSKSGKMTNTLALVAQQGSAITQTDFNTSSIREDKEWRLESASAVELNNIFFYEILPEYAIQLGAVIRHEDRGQDGPSVIEWYSLAVRPIFFINDNVSLALELGVDYVDDELHDRQGHLYKETVALQLARSRGFYERPVLRLFATYAQWSDDFRGSVGYKPDDAPYGKDTEGWSTGLQLEWWW